MKEIKLHKLTLSNFKGIKFFQIEPDGENIFVRGDNATGKTSLYDAYLWVLFGKDSHNRADFGIKTYDKNGDVISGLDHSVEAEFKVNGKPLTLKKVYREKWTKKRGEAERLLTGHETEHYINEVPCKAGEYSNYIQDLVDEEVFKLITSVTYFSQQMHWTKRRNLLMSIVGNLTDEEVIESDPELASLMIVLDDRSLEEHQKWVKSQKSKYNKEIVQIPTRIDEIERGLPTLSSKFDYAKLRQEKELLANKIEEIDQRINNQEAISKGFKFKQAELNRMYVELGELERTIEKKQRKNLSQLESELRTYEGMVSDFEWRIKHNTDQVRDSEKYIQNCEKLMEDLRNKWVDWSEKVFYEPSRDAFVCPTCKQGLPEHDIHSQIAELKKNFDKEVRENIKAISEAGAGWKAKKLAAQEDMARYQKQLEQLKADREKNHINIARLSQEIEKEKENLKGFDPSSDESYQKLKAKIDTLEQQLKDAESASTAKTEVDVKRSYQRELDEINQQLNSKDIIERQQKRIEELKEEEEKYRDLILDLEKDEYLLEKFTIKKVDMLETAINQRFDTVRFKLFNRLTNGAIEDCCEVTVDGVPYSDLNTAGTVNAGLDIINVLVDKYQVSAPIFIDNRESVNRIIDIDSQIINLIVSDDKKMKVSTVDDIKSQIKKLKESPEAHTGKARTEIEKLEALQ